MMDGIFLTSHLMGGLGNQMFQIAKATCEGFKNNLQVFFKPVSFIPMEGNQPTKYKDNIFRNVKFVDEVNPQVRIKEKTWAYYELNEKFNVSTEFFGYFQSSKNFLGFQNEIIDFFSPTQEFIDKIKKKYPNVFQKNSISIHIRRGDYEKISHILPIVDNSYIEASLDQIDSKGKIYIFSNDKKWVHNNLNIKNSIVVEDLEDYEELWMISLCNHNIMSNSSFSWWGAYLNKNENKKVIVPSKWFGNSGEKNYQDIYEPTWIKIETHLKDKKIVCY